MRRVQDSAFRLGDLEPGLLISNIQHLPRQPAKLCWRILAKKSPERPGYGDCTGSAGPYNEAYGQLLKPSTMHPPHLSKETIHAANVRDFPDPNTWLALADLGVSVKARVYMMNNLSTVSAFPCFRRFQQMQIMTSIGERTCHREKMQQLLPKTSQITPRTRTGPGEGPALHLHGQLNVTGPGNTHPKDPNNPM